MNIALPSPPLLFPLLWRPFPPPIIPGVHISGFFLHISPEQLGLFLSSQGDAFPPSKEDEPFFFTMLFLFFTSLANLPFCSLPLPVSIFK
jgi:hypothetical protein